MLTSLNVDLKDINDVRKTAIINDELLRLNVDIAALQETRLANTGSIKEKNYTFYWKGKDSNERRIHGVGFAVRNNLLKTTCLGSNGSPRILTMRLNTTKGPATIVSAYAPTLAASTEEKDEFYGKLSATIESISKGERIFLLGDFNARVGDDNTSWPAIIGSFGVGKMNENGQRLLEFCSYYDLVVTNSYFKTKPQHKMSWRHPRSKKWHQLDLVLTRRSSLKDITLTRSYHSANCDTDHSLVCCKLKVQAKYFYRTKQPGKPRIDTSKMSKPDLVQQFSTSLTEKLGSTPTEKSALSKWEKLRNTMYITALETFGKKTSKTCDWFDSKATVMMPVVEEKRSAHLQYINLPNLKNLQALKEARKKVRQSARRCANEYWVELSQKIQLAANTGNIREMYDGIKKAMGPVQRMTSSIKSSTGEILTDNNKQMERWVEHYSNLYSRLNTVSLNALDSLESLQTIDELDAVPSIEDLNVAIDHLTNGKAPGSDNIPPDLIKKCKSALLLPLHEILCQCWQEGEVPQDMRDAKIINLYKNKGERSDCNNYRGIFLLSIVGKIFARVILVRLQQLAERVYPESQCGFRSGRSTIDMIFSVRQLQEKCREQNRPLYISFIDLTKAFDLVSRDGLFKILTKIGCPPKLKSLIESFHKNMRGTVQHDGNVSKPFRILNGVKQGCVLAPTLFGIFFSLLLKQAFGTAEEGIYLHTRTDGKLFNPSRLKAKTKVKKTVIRDMLFADDAAIAAHSPSQLQSLMDRFANACTDFGLTVSLKKTKVLAQATTSPKITINNYQLEVVEQFIYLGSTITSKLSLKKELDRRIGMAASTFSRLSTRVWKNPRLSIKTKVTVYNACVVSTLLYGSECWTTNAAQEQRLNVFHMRSLRKLLGISWMSRTPNTVVLSKSGLPTMFTILRQRRLRWLGHVRRMNDGRIPKELLYGELSSGKRNLGRPQLRYRDVCKRDMKEVSININEWEELATDRSKWRGYLRTALKVGEEKIVRGLETRRKIRKERLNTANHVVVNTASRGLDP